jgi:hypothetical protein
MDGEDDPSFMVSDRDGIDGEWFSKFLSEGYGIILPICQTSFQRRLRHAKNV